MIFSADHSVWYTLFTAFYVGVITSFTPCIYPMIPITLGILHIKTNRSPLKNFIKAFVYVCGMATVYAVLGYIAATTTVLFGQWLANPFIVVPVIAVFIYLAFSMFGFYEISLPQFIMKRSTTGDDHSLISTFFMGALAGTVASPCLTPALALILGSVAKQGNPIIGFLTLFIFALGLGTLLIILGTFSGTLSALPRAGMWMVEVKKTFGFLMLMVSVYFLQPLISAEFFSALYWMIGIAALLYYVTKVGKSFLKKS
jgi:thioredoxin:protein disulfide reductase